MYYCIINDWVLMRMTINYIYDIFTLIYKMSSVRLDLNISGGKVLGKF